MAVRSRRPRDAMRDARLAWEAVARARRSTARWSLDVSRGCASEVSVTRDACASSFAVGRAFGNGPPALEPKERRPAWASRRSMLTWL